MKCYQNMIVVVLYCDHISSSILLLLSDVSMRTMVIVRMKRMCIQLLLLDIQYNSPLHLASAPVVLKVPDCATRRQERLQPMA